MKKIIITVFIICILAILLLVWSWDEQNLGDDYYYLPSYEAKDIGFPFGSIIYKSERKYVFDSIIISKYVVSAKSNKNYILVAQKPENSDIKSDSIQFYIIVKKRDKVYGPFNQFRYHKKREELGIPKRIKLKVE